MNNRIDIKAGGYARASGYLNDANQLALMAYNHLSTDLAATGAMAGTDTTAADFATTYDQAAQATLSSIGDLVTALACLGIAIHTSLENHLHAEHSAAHSAARAGHTDNPSPVTDTQPLYAAGTWYDPIPATIPTSLGGDPTTLPGWANTVLDHIGGLVWPDADTTRLYTAATAYDTTATAVFDLTEHQHLAADHLTHQHSPEIPTALAEIDHTVQLTYQLSYRLTALARTCRTYAETVEEHRRQTLDLITDLLRDTAIFEAVGGLFDLVTGPVGTFVASDAALARISAKAPEFLRILDTLRDLTRTYTTALRALLDETRLLAPQLQRLTKLRLAQRTERGAIDAERLLKGIRETIGNPKAFNPEELRGMDPGDLKSLLKDWQHRPSTRGRGTVYVDPLHRGRQIRIMEGYPGNRPDSLTHGPYVVVSQGPPVKIALKGNPTL